MPEYSSERIARERKSCRSGISQAALCLTLFHLDTDRSSNSSVSDRAAARPCRMDGTRARFSARCSFGEGEVEGEGEGEGALFIYPSVYLVRARASARARDRDIERARERE